MRRLRPLLTALLLVACNARQAPTRTELSDTVAAGADSVVVGVSTRDARFVANVTGLQDPESVRYDAEQDAYFVSNMTGNGSDRDGNGYVVRIAAVSPYGGAVLVRGGADGVTLHAPKGMAIHGDTLWVADIDVLRGFHRRTGARLAEIDFAPLGAVMLNGVAVAPDGTLRVTDTGIHMKYVGIAHTGPDRIFKVGPDGVVSEMANGLALRQPNGIAWDSAGSRWLVVSFDTFAGEVAAFPRDGGERRVLHRSTRGRFDGLVVLPNGAALYTSWMDSSVHVLRDGRDRRLVREVPEAAGLGLDTRRMRLAVPLAMLGRVQIWELGPGVTR